MASRLTRSALTAARLRPAIPLRTLPPLLNPASSARFASNVPSEEPSKRAQSIVDALPGNSLASKSAILSAGTGAAIWAIANEIYVVDEETIVMIATLSVFWGIGHYGGPMFREWCDNAKNRINGVLQDSRKDHANFIQQRIDEVKKVGDVVEITKQLFEVSKETAKLEAEAFELEQKTALAAEAKSVLDSWVRYESQMKQRQQKELAQNIISKITKELENQKTLQQILNQSVADVESE
ncbi:MAG: hypothetical protein Q9190_006179 [Brigantiaea leucoxantha]